MLALAKSGGLDSNFGLGLFVAGGTIVPQRPLRHPVSPSCSTWQGPAMEGVTAWASMVKLSMIIGFDGDYL